MYVDYTSYVDISSLLDSSLLASTASISPSNISRCKFVINKS